MRTWQKVVLGAVAILAFVGGGVVVYTVVNNAVTRDELCQAVNALNTIERAKTVSDKKQTKGLHIKGISHEQLRHARRLDDRYINQLDKAVCGLRPKAAPPPVVERTPHRKTASKTSAPPASPPSLGRRGSGSAGLTGVAQPPSPATTSPPTTTSPPSGSGSGSGGSGGGNPSGGPTPPSPGPPPKPQPPPPRPVPTPPPTCVVNALGIKVCLPPL